MHTLSARVHLCADDGSMIIPLKLHAPFLRMAMNVEPCKVRKDQTDDEVGQCFPRDLLLILLRFEKHGGLVLIKCELLLHRAVLLDCVRLSEA